MIQSIVPQSKGSVGSPGVPLILVEIVILSLFRLLCIRPSPYIFIIRAAYAILSFISSVAIHGENRVIRILLVFLSDLFNLSIDIGYVDLACILIGCSGRVVISFLLSILWVGTQNRCISRLKVFYSTFIFVVMILFIFRGGTIRRLNSVSV